MTEVREITDCTLWDDFVGESPQGTIFSTTKWMGLFPCESRIYGYFKGDSLLGGIIGKHLNSLFWSGGFDLTPFQGILVQPIDSNKESTILSLHHEVATALSEYLKRNYDSAKIYNHYTFPDIRSFIWQGWEMLPVKYTQVIDLTDLDLVWNNLEKQTRYEITRAERDGFQIEYDKLQPFAELYSQTFKRKGLIPPVDTKFLEQFYKKFKPTIITVWNDSARASAVIMKDNKRAYYIFGASEGGLGATALWEALPQDRKEIDLVGCNDKLIAQFKKGFGGKLTPYYGVSRV